MKFKLVVVDLELSRGQKAVLATGVGAALVMAGAVALADVPNTFAPGDTLTAADLNENFAAIEARIAAHDTRLADAETTVADLSDEVDILAAPRTKVSLGTSNSFVIPSGVWTRVPFDNVHYDELGEFDTSTSQLVAAEAGDYLVCASQFIGASVPFELDIYVDDARVRAFAASPPPPNVQTSGCTVVRLQAGGRMDVRTLQASGNPVTSTGDANYLWSWLDIQRL